MKPNLLTYFTFAIIFSSFAYANFDQELREAERSLKEFEQTAQESLNELEKTAQDIEKNKQCLEIWNTFLSSLYDISLQAKKAKRQLGTTNDYQAQQIYLEKLSTNREVIKEMAYATSSSEQEMEEELAVYIYISNKTKPIFYTMKEILRDQKSANEAWNYQCLNGKQDALLKEMYSE